MMEAMPNLTERDFVLTWNLMPNDYTEAITLIPSLKALDEKKVSEMVKFLIEKRGHGHSAM